MRALALLVAVGCSEVGLNDSSKGPELSFVQPVDGGRFDPTELVSVCAALDYDGAVETLDVILVSDVGGTLATTGFAPCDGGELGIEVPLSDEPHVISMTATDVQGRSSTAIASITPSPNGAPSCSVITPMNGTALPIGTEVTMSVRVDDDEGPIDVAVDSNVDGAVANDTVATSGNAQFAFGLTPGPHDLVVTVTDSRDVAAACGVSIALVECEDLDNDGFENCEGDCNDNDPAIFPGAQETPDGVDNDCDGDIDEGTGNFDDDGDGFSELDGDCDDTDAQIFPGQTEIPDDGIDQDCDGNDAITCFEDLDDDGYGSSNTVVALDGLCDDAGEAPVDGDCDDTDPTLNPGAPDIPDDGIDQDCDGTDPDGCFEDSDGDGFGSDTVLPPGDGDCDDPGESNFSNDCDDTDPTVFPGATEDLDDGVDQDCSGADRVTCYDDLDLDGYAGDTVVPEEESCTQGSATFDDCDDTDNTINPGVTDTPNNGIDEDCSGSDAVRCFVDADMDTYGSGAVVVAADGECNTSQMESDNDEDCDDADPTVFPGAPETSGDGIDQNCSGSDSSDCFEDADGDGWGTSTTVPSADADCDDPGEAGQSGDCRDGNPAVNPGATEIPDNAIDEDCSGAAAITCQQDLDQDTYGSTDTTIAQDGSCDTADRESTTSNDCDDANPNVNPGSVDVPDNGLDDDCSGAQSITCQLDQDRDGYGHETSTRVADDGECNQTQQEAVLGNNTDCDDTDAAINPAATEIVGNTVDEDCDGDTPVWCYDDTDGDGFGAGAQYEDPDGVCGDGQSVNDGDCAPNDPAEPGVDGICGGECGAQVINPGDLVITEIMIKNSNDGGIGGGQGEWFELHNTTGSAIGFCGDWQFSDNSGTVSVDEPSLIVPAGGYVVFAAMNAPVNVPPEARYLRDSGDPGNSLLLGSGDQLVVEFEGAVVDDVVWDDVGNNDWADFDVTGSAVQLDPTMLDWVSNDEYVNWCLASTPWPAGNGDNGTPGEPNAACF